MTAGADEDLSVPFSAQLHPFMADWAACIGCPCDSLPVSAFSVLADEHLAVLSFYGQKKFSTLWASLSGHIIVAEASLSLFDFGDQILRVASDFLHKDSPALPSFRDG